MSSVDREPNLIADVQKLMSRVDALERSTTGHAVSSQGTPPTFTIGGPAGVGAGGLLTLATDVAGQIDVTTGAGAAAGIIITVSFAVTYPNAPHIVLVPYNGNAADALGREEVFPVSSILGFDINSTNGLDDTTTFQWIYHVIEGRN